MGAAGNATFGLTGLLVFVIVVILIVFAKKRCIDRRRRRTHSDSAAAADEESSSFNEQNEMFVKDPFRDLEQKTSERWGQLPDNVKWMLKGHIIDYRKVRLGGVIGKGQFGCVYEAFLTKFLGGSNDYGPVSCQKVAAKTLKGDNLSIETIEAFLKEGMLMKDFCHPNVLSLIGVTIDGRGVPMILLPFMLHGSLKNYIKNPTLMLTVRDLLMYSEQIADGMRYLAEKKFVHRDLATRNCMLDETLTVKVADFGLSRDIYTKDYYTSEDRHVKLPVKWMALESLVKATYTVKTDVWSFGVVLWELLTRGSTPYPDISNWDVRSYLQAGRRMAKPDACPEEIYELMLRCWSENPDERPTFAEVYNDLHSMLDDQEHNDDGDDDDETKREHDYVNLYQNVCPNDDNDDEEERVAIDIDDDNNDDGQPRPQSSKDNDDDGTAV